MTPSNDLITRLTIAIASTFLAGSGVTAASGSPPAPDPTLAFLTSEEETGGASVRVLSFKAEAVDGVDLMIVRDSGISIEHREFDEIRGWTTEVHNTVPREGAFRIVVRNKLGRPKVTVTQQPGADNNYESRVLIDDGPAGGASPLSFDLVALPFMEARTPRNVVIITIDSLRADRLGCYGYERPTSPNLDRFAEQSVRYENAFSTSSFTPPSHASIMTSRYVSDHGLYTWNRLPEEQLTLAEVLDRHGYRTGASVNIGLLSDQGLGQGFAFQKDAYRDVRRVVEDGLHFIRDESDAPYFLWLHFYDVHRPYGRVGDWKNRFADDELPGVGDGEDHYGLRPEDVETRGLDPDDLQYICDRYDGGIAYLDAQLAPLLEELSTPRAREDTLLIVTADHGESLLDHPDRLFTHDPFLYTVVTRVPLLIRYPTHPRSAGTVFEGLISLIDVAPTVLGVVGVEAPPTFHGLDASPSVPGQQRPRKWARSELYSECWGWEELKAIRNENHLIIRDLAKERTLFFDLQDNPAERSPAAKAPDPGARTLEKLLQEFTLRRPETDGPPPLDPEIIKKLRELGYLGG